MPEWKKNLMVCWFGSFVASAGLSQVAPILPLFIEQLGVRDPGQIVQYSGLAFGITFVLSGIFSPIWGAAADKYGRKPMLLRASLGMSLIITCMGFSQNVQQVIILRMLLGVIGGYTTTCMILIATQTNEEHVGHALGILSTANIAGSLCGPMLGGYIGSAIGLRYVFFTTGTLLMIAFIATILFVKESFVRKDQKILNMLETWNSVTDKVLTISMFVTFFVLSFALYSIEPIITVYIKQMTGNVGHVALLAGVAFSASGLASILAAPWLGSLADRVGPQKIILVALLVAGFVFVPQAFVKNVWQLVALRFFLGLATAGLNPSINSMIRRITPDAIAGRIYGLNMTAGYLGIFGGAILGGQIAALLGIRSVFFMTSGLLIGNALWVYAKVYRRLKD